jgi:copper chaperone NosL
MLRAMWIGMVVLVVASCGRSVPAPEEPVWGKQPCANCAMLLSEKAHGAQVLTAEGDRLFFDDLGCLVAWSMDKQAPGAQWVRTTDTQSWLTTDRAHFAPAAHTPMDFGFVATSQPGPLDWQQVTEAVRHKLQNKQE